MRALRFLFLLPVLALCLSVSPAAADDGPQAVLKKNIDAFITILRDAKYAAPEQKDAQRDEIWKVINRVFDFEGVAILAVGRNWQRFSEPEKKVFADDFAHLLANNYLNKIQEGYKNEKVNFISEQMFGPKKALVKTEIVRSGGNIPVDYNMWDRGQGWRAYDVKVEGVSLVQNYRAQFNQILLGHEPAYLINMVKDKLKAQKQ